MLKGFYNRLARLVSGKRKQAAYPGPADAERLFRGNDKVLRRAVMDVSPSAILFTDTDAIIIEGNRKAASLFGLKSADELKGRRITDIFLTQNMGRAFEIENTLRKNGTVNEEEMLFHVQYLSFFWGELSASAVAGKNGIPVAFLWIIKDISDRKRVEAEKRESGRRYKSLFEESRDAIFLTTRDGRFIDVNRAALEAFGYTREEMLGSSALDLVWPDQAGRLHFVEEIEREGFVRDFETSLKRRDGGILECVLTASLRRDSDGAITGYQGIVRDITERKRAESQREAALEALRALEEQESGILQAIPHAVVGLQNREIVFVNESVKNVFGWEPSDLIGRTTRVFYRSDAEFESIAGHFYPVLEKQRTHTEDYTCRRRDGGDFVCRVSASRIGDSLVDKKIVVVYQDITGTIQAARALGEQKRFTESLIQNFEVPAFVIDGNHRVMLWNTACETLTGISGQDIIGTTGQWRAFYPDERPTLADIVIDRRFDALAGLYETFSKSLFIEDSWHAEGWYPGIGGRERYMIFDAVPIFNDTGEITAAVETLQDITVLKKTEEALRLSEASYRAIFENTGAATIIIEEDTTISLVNSEFERLSGYSREELERRQSWTEFVETGDLERMVKYHYLRRTKGGAAPKNYEFRFHTRSGEVRDIYLTVAMIPGTRRSVASILDVTERKRSEELLRESESRFRALAETSPAAIFTYRKNFLYVNSASEKLTGYSLEELRSMQFHELVHPEFRELVQSRGQARQRGEAVPSHYEFKILKKNGQERWVDFAGTLIQFEGEPAGLGTAFDITERKNAEEEMSKMRHYLQNVIDSMPSIMAGVDREGRITHWNQMAERAAGIEHPAAEGRYLEEVLPELGDQRETIRRAISLREPQRTGRTARNADGELRYSDVMVYPLIGAGVEGAVLRVDDVTDRVRMEEMMIQTEKMMSVGGLAAGMAHEINNPLGGILMGADNVIRRISPDIPANVEAARECGTGLESIRAYMEKRDIIKMLEGIREMGARASRIVANMLSFSRRSEPNLEPEDLAELLDRTVELASHDYDLAKRYDFRNIEVQRDYAASLPRVPCMATEIEQVVLNLIKNAAQAMAGKTYNEDHPRITLRLKQDGRAVRIEVEDNGPGVDDTIRKRIFEPFFTTKEAGAGTGLGLSVSYFIITGNHKGTMALESDPGRGARFVIHLPLGAA